ncbi:MAG TPA: hypothetical protein VJJ24_01490 [Candidatus Paceibacterota bacterium]
MKRTLFATLVATVVATFATAAPHHASFPPSLGGHITDWVLKAPSVDGSQMITPVTFGNDCNLTATVTLPADTLLPRLVGCRFSNDCALVCDSPVNLAPLIGTPGLSMEIRERQWVPGTFGRSFGLRWADGSSLFVVTSEALPPDADGIHTPSDNDTWWHGYVTLADDPCVWHTSLGVVGAGLDGRPDSCGCGPGFCTCGWMECTIEVNGDSLGGSLQQMGGLGGP